MSTPYVLLVLHAVSVIIMDTVFPFQQTLCRFNIGPVLTGQNTFFSPNCIGLTNFG